MPEGISVPLFNAIAFAHTTVGSDESATSAAASTRHQLTYFHSVVVHSTLDAHGDATSHLFGACYTTAITDIYVKFHLTLCCPLYCVGPRTTGHCRCNTLI